MRRTAALAWLIAVVAGCAGVPAPASDPNEGPAGNRPDPAAHAVLLKDVVPHWGPGPDGPQLLDEWGENPSPLGAGRRVVLLEAPVAGPGGPWVRVWIAPDPSVAPGDFYAWLPVTLEGRPALRIEAAPPCPEVATIQAVAGLLQTDRLRCFGDRPLRLEADSWLPGTWPTYDVDPAWYGTNADAGATISLYDRAAGSRPPDPSVGWIDARVPPGVSLPPRDFRLAVDGAFGHGSAQGCRRTLDRTDWDPRPPPGAGVPLEAPEDSVRWCREQFVVTPGWEVVSGPEGRPLDPAAPQLHRTAPPPLGEGFACAGVGMPPLRLRIDLQQVDPVWLEAGGARGVLPFFGPEFRLVPGEDPHVTAPGVLLRDGDVIDPDRGQPGLAVCPGGETVSFSVLPNAGG